MYITKNARWLKNIVYDWDQRGNLYYFLGLSAFTVIICLVAYGLSGRAIVFLGLPAGFGVGASIYLRLYIVPASVGISPNRLLFTYRIGQRLKTYLWRDISEIRFKNAKGDPLMPHRWKTFNIHLKNGERTKHGINVSNEIFESIHTASMEYGIGIHWIESDS